MHPAGKSHFVGIVGLLARHVCLPVSIYSSAFFIISITWTYHTFAVHSTTDCTSQLCNWRCWDSSQFLCIKYDSSESSEILGGERRVNQKSRSEVRNQNQTTCCPHTIEKRRRVEHKIVVEIDVFLLPCTKHVNWHFQDGSWGGLKKALICSYSPQRPCWGPVEVETDGSTVCWGIWFLFRPVPFKNSLGCLIFEPTSG